MLVRPLCRLLFGIVLASTCAQSSRNEVVYRRRPQGKTVERADLLEVKQQQQQQEAEQELSVQTVSLQASPQEHGLGVLSSSFAELLEASKPKTEVHKNVKTYIFTKKVPVPYTVQYETRFPYPIKFPVRRPYTVYVPKPYYVEIPKPMPYTVKVPVPQPYHVEKHIPYPYKVPFDKPVPYQVAKPYPVFVEKKVPVPVEKPVPVQVKIPVDRPIPVHIPVEKPIVVPVEKPVLYPVRIPVDRPIPIPVEKPVPVPVPSSTTYEVKVNEEPQAFPAESQEVTGQLKVSSDFTPSPYDALASSLASESKKVISFLPGSGQNLQVTKQEYSFDPIVFSSDQSSKWSTPNSTDWVPRFETGFQVKTNQEPFRIIASPTDLQTVQSDNRNLQKTSQVVQQNQYYSVIPASQQKQSAHKYQENALPLQVFRQENKIVPGEGNYQFFNVHPTQQTKPDITLPGVSFQSYDTEVKPSVEPPAQWVQLPQQYSTQETIKEEQHNSKVDLGQQQQHAAQQVTQFQDIIQNKNFEQYSPYQQELAQEAKINQQYFVPKDFNQNQYANIIVQENSEPKHQNLQQGLSHQELGQFNNQNFPQLQQYQYQTNVQSLQFRQNFQQPTTQFVYQQPQQNQPQPTLRPIQYQQQQQQQQVSEDYGLAPDEHYQNFVPSPIRQEQQYHQQTITPAQNFQSFEQQQQQQQQKSDQGVNVYVGGSKRRRHRQPSSGQQLVDQQQPAKTEAQQTNVLTMETSTPSGSTSTEYTPRMRKTRRRNRKRIANNTNNNTVETTTTPQTK